MSNKTITKAQYLARLAQIEAEQRRYVDRANTVDKGHSRKVYIQTFGIAPVQKTPYTMMADVVSTFH